MLEVKSRCTVYFVSQMPKEFNARTLPYSYRYCSLLNVMKLQVLSIFISVALL